MFISDEVFAQLHQELILEHKAKLRMITDNNKLYRILQEIKSIAERAFAVCDDDCGNANKFKEIIELTKAEEA